METLLTTLDPTFQETIILGRITTSPKRITDKNNNEIVYFNAEVVHYYTHPQTNEQKVHKNIFNCEIRGEVATTMAMTLLEPGDLALITGNVGIVTNQTNNNSSLILKGRVLKTVKQ